MRVGPRIVAVLVMISAVWAADQPSSRVAVPCASGVRGSPPCLATPEARREAKNAFERGLKLQKEKRLDEALSEFERAADLIPQDIQYVTVRELVRQQLVFDHIQRGNEALASSQQVLALGEFRSALHLDPANEFARQRLNDALGPSAPTDRKPPRLVESSSEIVLAPLDQRQSFHFRGDAKNLLTQVATSYGISAIFDDSVTSRRVRFDVENVDFFKAMILAGEVTKTFWSPLEPKQILLAADTTENHRVFDRMGLRTFYIPDVGSAQELSDLVNVVRTVFEVKFVNSNAQANTITIRASQNVLEPLTRFLETLGSGKPEVMLEVRIFEISHSLIYNFGMHIPNQFTLYNIPIAALGLTLAGGPSIQSLINQLIASGAINQATSSGVQALLAQLLGSSGASSIFSQPLATFGGGKTLMGVTLGTLTATLSKSDSQVRSLQHVTLRAAQNKDATVKLGSRYPIINASFAPIFNTSAISQAIQGGSFLAPVPSFTYEDIGVDLKVKPVVHGDSDVSLTLDLKVRALTGASANGVPVIGNREFTGSINAKNEQSVVVAGELSRTELHSLSGLPGIGMIPGLSAVLSTNTKENDENELLVLITPHIISIAETPSSEIWMTGVK